MENNNLQLFKNSELGEVRALNVGGNPWFIASDVCKVLGLSNPTMAMKQLDEDERAKFSLGLRGGEVNVITESGLYALVIRSSKPEAKRFKKWITAEVLPAIRQTGGYIQVSETDTEETIMAKALMIAQKTIERQSKKLEELTPKAEGFDKWLNREYSYSFEQVAKILSTSPAEHEFGLGVDVSRISLPRFLREMGILSKHRTKSGFRNLPNKDYEQYFNVIFLEDGYTTQTRVKANGIKYIHDTLKAYV